MGDTPTSIMESLKARAEIVATHQSADMPEADKTMVAQAQVNAVLAAIQTTVGFDPSSVVAYNKVVNEGPWTPAQKSALLTAAAGRLNAVEAAPSKKGARAQQYCAGFHRYPTKKEVQLLQDPSKQDWDKQNLFAQRCWSVGISCPSESLKVRIALMYFTAVYNSVPSTHFTRLIYET